LTDFNFPISLGRYFILYCAQTYGKIKIRPNKLLIVSEVIAGTILENQANLEQALLKQLIKDEKDAGKLSAAHYRARRTAKLGSERHI